MRSVVAGPFEELDKTDLPGQVCQFTLEVLRAEARAEPGRYDLIHAHYWLSGKVGAAAKERWRVPLVQSMHTLGKVKNAALAAGETAEPDERIRGEHEVVAVADRLVANTAQEATPADRTVRRRPRPGCGPSARGPTCRSSSLATPGRKLRSRRDLASPPMRSSCCSRAGSSPSRGRTSCSRRPPGSSRGTQRCAGLRVVLVGGPSGKARAPTRTGCGNWLLDSA